MKTERQMTLEQAKAEARLRWGVHGGWAEEELISYPELQRWERRVGWRTNEGHGSRQVQLGSGKTFEKAFQSAERKLESMKEQRKLSPKPQLGYPTVEIDFNESVSHKP